MLKDEWLQELARRVSHQFVSRVVEKGPPMKLPGPENAHMVESWLVSNPRERCPADLSPASLIAASTMGNFQCQCCQDLNPLVEKKDMKLLQKMFGSCVASDLFSEFRSMAEKHLAGELEHR